VVTRQIQAERRTAKERWPETDVLPLSHADSNFDSSDTTQRLLAFFPYANVFIAPTLEVVTSQQAH